MWVKLGIFCTVAVVIFGQSTLPQVTISQGTVVGSLATDGDYFEFHGIPYADSTSGSHRFKAPSPPPSFQDTFVADRKDIRCVRALGIGYEGTEDCLVANIYTPSLDSDSHLPVMVWVKGKEFDKGYEHELTFKKFVEKGVIVVSLNFRESVLGFLCLGTETAPGNAGLKDIVAGLKWVQQNIIEFGGNPQDVTLFGHGSGAAAVDLITMSLSAQGLVHRAISQSGNAFAPWAVTRDNLKYAVQVAEALGHTVDDIETLSKVFTKTSVAALMAVINELDLTDDSLAFAPCIERENLDKVVPFLTKSPYNTLLDGDFLQIPFMTGFVDHEGTIRAEEALESDWMNKMETDFKDFIQPDLQFDNEEQETQIANEIREFYFGQDSNIDFQEYLTYHGDTMILVSTIREARLRSTATNAPLYLYQFSYSGVLGQPFIGPISLDTAVYSEELAYMFYETPDVTVPSKDLTVSDILVERWTNFAKTGVPTTEISKVEWQPFTVKDPNYLRILDNDEVSEDFGATLEVSLVNPHSDTVNFWNHIYVGHFLDAEGKWTLDNRNEDDEEGSGEDGGENGGEDGDENDGEDGDENGGEDSNENGGEDGDENGGEDGDENSSEDGDENGSEDGDENSSEDGDENGGEDSDENGGEDSDENGGEDGDENGGEDGDENGGEDSDENSSEDGDENGGVDGDENSGEDSDENGGEDGDENGGEDGDENGGEDGDENGGEDGDENGGEDGDENGGEEGDENSSEDSDENGGEDSDENSNEDGDENGGEDGDENGGEDSDENGGEDGDENGGEDGDENSSEDSDENGSEEDGSDEDGDGDGNEGDSDEGDGDGDPDSASTAVGYTFLIISLFSILSNFHSSQILS